VSRPIWPNTDKRRLLMKSITRGKPMRTEFLKASMLFPISVQYSKLKSCPHCSRKVRLSHKSATVAEMARKRRISATVWTEFKSYHAFRRYGGLKMRQISLPVSLCHSAHPLRIFHLEVRDETSDYKETIVMCYSPRKTALSKVE